MNGLANQNLAHVCVGLLIVAGLCHAWEPTDARGEDVDPAWTPLDRADSIAALELISRGVRMNNGRIQTWTGQYDIEELQLLHPETSERFAKQIDPERPADGIRYHKLEWLTCDFVVDVAGNRIFTSLEGKEPPKLLDAYSGADANAYLWRTFQKTIVTPSEFLSFQPERVYPPFKDYPLVPQAGEGNDGRVAFREPRNAGQDDRQVSPIDPRKLLFDFASRDTTGELAKLLASDTEKDLAHVRDVELTVSQAVLDGKVQFKVTHHSPLPNGVDISVERVFAEDADYSPIDESLLRLPERVLVQRDEWSYERVDGVVLPATQRRRLLTLDGARLNFDRTYTLRESHVNQPISDETFTVSTFGLQTGDRYVDDAQGTLQVWQEGELISAEKFQESRWNRLATIALLTSPVMLVVWVYVSRRRRRLRATSARIECTSMLIAEDGLPTSLT